MIKAEIHEFYLPYPNMKDRRVRVYVPEHKEGERLPVIYMTDGQNLFDGDSCVWGCWHTIEAVEAEMQSGLGGAVIVAIDHGNEHRDNELTPGSIGKVICADEMENFTEPLGEEFDSFLVNKVMPYVEANFPIIKDRTHTAICGSSSGGLQSFFTGLEHSDKFSMIGAFSPAFLLYTEEDMRAWIVSKLRETLPYLYLYTGSGDELEQRIYQSTEMVYDILMEIGYPYESMNEVVMFDYRHHEDAWAEIFKDFLHTFLARTSGI